MKVGEYKIRWRYYPDASIHCYIKNYKDAVVGIDGATCAKTDHFCRDTGRKISLARAMKDAKLDKAQRTEIWEAYRNMTRKMRW